MNVDPTPGIRFAILVTVLLWSCVAALLRVLWLAIH